MYTRASEGGVQGIESTNRWEKLGVDGGAGHTIERVATAHRAIAHNYAALATIGRSR